MDKIPLEILRHILSDLEDILPSFKDLAHYVSVSRAFQQVIEAKTFRFIKISSAVAQKKH